MVGLLGGPNYVKNLIKFFGGGGVIDIFYFFSLCSKEFEITKDFKGFFLVVNEVH